MGEMVKVSFDRDEMRAIKRAITNDRPFADRISLSFAVRLLSIKADLREDHFVLDEIDYLEGLRPPLNTKPAEQFRHPPLHPLWHKHYSAPRHLLKNIGIRWNLDGSGNKDLLSMLGEVANTHGKMPDQWPKVVVDRLVIGGFIDRTKRGLTGDWIIFGKHGGRNFYLDLATHNEGKQGVPSERLYQKLRDGSAAEFPFLFE
ncbi:MAG: hypothetical protein WAL80_13150 [Xanthobacteraceae bacterium]